MAPVKDTGAIVAAVSVSMAVLSYLFISFTSKKATHFANSKNDLKNKSKKGLIDAVGNTPLIRINSLSDATGCEALASGKLYPGGVVTEGSVGSTAISLATVAPAYGCKCHVVIPDDVAIEKSQILEALGATVERVRPVSITHKDHFVNVARQRAQEANELASECRNYDQVDGKDPKQINGYLSEGEKQGSVFPKHSSGGFFADQFENLANSRAHYEGTGREIWEQTKGSLDAFVAAAGTGGTVAGVSRFLKEKNSNIKCFLIDPPGSGLFNKITRGVMYSKEEAEGKRLKNPFDTITEGIGINRITDNFMMAKLDGAFRGTDKEAVEMSSFLLKNDGLFLGSSSAMNCVGAVRVAQSIGPGHTIVTILCDSGMRHLSKFHSAEYLSQHGLTPTATGLEFLGIK
ncbi:cysteine synthase 2 isoform X2 [Mercurialis annua]|uniref:cysteine synthase 2 isoform X2 n=1 Tax=Mercurialis annua TaxID=3986 RepID=UPI00215F55C1|nr:cysteine synthase 2 isoform X2 [Mercurialis annua]